MAEANLETLRQGLADLQGAVESGPPPRPVHLLPDLAVDMLACQLYAHGYAVWWISQSEIPDSAYPSARAAFETAEDLLVLVLAPSIEDFNRLGAQAYVAGEIAMAKVAGHSDHAASVIDRHDLKKVAAPLKEAIQLGIDHWKAARPDASEIVDAAKSEVSKAWKSGAKHWSGKSRSDLHEVARERLNDRTMGPLLSSWYDHLAHRSHPGLHWPRLRAEDGILQFLINDPEAHPDPIPLATAFWAVTTGLHVIKESTTARKSGSGAEGDSSGA